MIDANTPPKRSTSFQTLTIAACIVAALYIFLAPAFRSARMAGQSQGCKDNLKRLSSALVMYAQDWDHHFPPANAWMDCIDNDKYLDTDRPTIFHCPAGSSKYSYAMNAQVSGKSDWDLDTSNTVLLFETDSSLRNANGTQTSLALPRHGQLNCSFCDGTTAWVNPYTKGRWKWSVPKH